MKTIYTPDTYQCEICGNIYDTRETAIACEALGSPEPLLAIGDVVLVASRYDGFLEATIVGISIGKRAFKHTCLYTLNRDIQICKDGDTSKSFFEGELIKLSDITWRDSVLDCTKARTYLVKKYNGEIFSTWSPEGYEAIANIPKYSDWYEE